MRGSRPVFTPTSCFNDEYHFFTVVLRCPTRYPYAGVSVRSPAGGQFGSRQNPGGAAGHRLALFPNRGTTSLAFSSALVTQLASGFAADSLLAESPIAFQTRDRL